MLKLSEIAFEKDLKLFSEIRKLFFHQSIVLLDYTVEEWGKMNTKNNLKKPFTNSGK